MRGKKKGLVWNEWWQLCEIREYRRKMRKLVFAIPRDLTFGLKRLAEHTEKDCVRSKSGG